MTASPHIATTAEPTVTFETVAPIEVGAQFEMRSGKFEVTAVTPAEVSFDHMRPWLKAPGFRVTARVLQILLVLAIYAAPAASYAGGAGSGRRCNPDAAVCTACKDCTKCRTCAKEGKSCSVMRDQSGEQQRARDAKRAKH